MTSLGVGKCGTGESLSPGVPALGDCEVGLRVTSPRDRGCFGYFFGAAVLSILGAPDPTYG